MRKAALVLTAAVGSLVFGLTGAFGGAEAAPGVTAKVVKIGGTFPFSGAAAPMRPSPVVWARTSATRTRRSGERTRHAAAAAAR